MLIIVESSIGDISRMYDLKSDVTWTYLTNGVEKQLPQKNEVVASPEYPMFSIGDLCVEINTTQ